MHAQAATPKPNRLLIVILVGFAALSVVYSSVTRLKCGPDEPAHFIYIRSLATTFSPPPIAHEQTHTEDSIASHEGHQPPLYYAVMAGPFGVLNAVGVEGDTIWRILRILGIGIGVFWIYWVNRLAGEFFGDERYALATAAFVALIPNSAYTAGVVSNDALVALLFTWALVPMLRFFKAEKLTPRQAAGLGMVMGLAILAKAQGLILVPVLLVAALAVCRRRDYTNLAPVVGSVGMVLGVAALVSGWWFVRCQMLYDTPMPHSLYNPVLPDGLISLLSVPEDAPAVLWLSSSNLFMYFWTPFWLVWKYVNPMYYLWPLLVVTAAALIGLVPRVRRGGVDRSSLWLLAFTAILTWVMWLRYALTVDSMANLQGRLLLSVGAIIGIVFVLGIEGWLHSARAKRGGVIVGAALMLAANAAVVCCIVAFYAAG